MMVPPDQISRARAASFSRIVEPRPWIRAGPSPGRGPGCGEAAMGTFRRRPLAFGNFVLDPGSLHQARISAPNSVRGNRTRNPNQNSKPSTRNPTQTLYPQPQLMMAERQQRQWALTDSEVGRWPTLKPPAPGHAAWGRALPLRSVPGPSLPLALAARLPLPFGCPQPRC
jgi:hypothetical protein